MKRSNCSYGKGLTMHTSCGYNVNCVGTQVIADWWQTA
jgi:hypothetical protein